MLLIIISVFLFILLLIISIVILYNNRNKQEKRINKFISQSDSIERVGKINEDKYVVTNFIKKISKSSKKKSKKSKIEMLLINADSNLSVEEFTVIRVILIMITSTAYYLLSGKLLLLVIIPIIIWYFPVLLLTRSKKKRIKKFEDQLGDAISMFANSLKAGYSYLQSINSVAKDMPDPIGKEFKILLKEMSLGVNANKALDNLATRVDSKDLGLMITAIKIQQETGGNLAEILSNISETIRERIKIQGEVKTLTAQGRMSGLVVGFMPPVLIGLLFLINKEYIQVLFTTTIGKMILGFAVISETIGVLIIKKIVKIDV